MELMIAPTHRMSYIAATTGKILPYFVWDLIKLTPENLLTRLLDQNKTGDYLFVRNTCAAKKWL